MSVLDRWCVVTIDVVFPHYYSSSDQPFAPLVTCTYVVHGPFDTPAEAEEVVCLVKAEGDVSAHVTKMTPHDAS